MPGIFLKAYAKINLFLDVTGRAENGYHQVRTVMQSVSLCDEVEVELDKSGSYSIECDDARVPTDRNNLVWRAAELFFDAVGRDDGVKIKIKKRNSF